MSEKIPKIMEMIITWMLIRSHINGVAIVIIHVAAAAVFIGVGIASQSTRGGRQHLGQDLQGIFLCFICLWDAVVVRGNHRGGVVIVGGLRFPPEVDITLLLLWHRSSLILLTCDRAIVVGGGCNVSSDVGQIGLRLNAGGFSERSFEIVFESIHYRNTSRDMNTLAPPPPPLAAAPA